MRAIDVLRALDIMFSNANIYPPLMREIKSGQWVGDVSDEEYVVFEMKNDELVGISYDGHQFTDLSALEEDLEIIHSDFNNKRYKIEEITQDRIIILNDPGY